MGDGAIVVDGAGRGDEPVRRLSGADQSMVWPDDRGWPQDIGVVLVLTGGGLIRADGAVNVERLRRHVASRLHVMPRFRECIGRPPVGCGGPYWADAATFDVSDHVRATSIPAPGGDSEVFATWERLRRRPFDPTRPRWELVVGEGMTNDRVAIFLRVHHALVDGVAGIAALGALLDEAGDVAPTPTPWTPRPPPSAGQLRRDALQRRTAALLRLVGRLRHPLHLFRRLRQAIGELRRIAALTGAPRTSFNQPIGPRRHTAAVRTRLDGVRDAAHRHDATVNDVLLTAVTIGMRSLLDGHGEALRALPRAAVPVAGRASATGGNTTVSSLVVPLPIDEIDPVQALQRIRRETVRQKQHPLSYAEAGIISSPALERVASRLAGRQRMVNLLVSNVPGPPTPLHVLSAEITQLLPMVPLNGNMSLGVGAISYAGELAIVAVGDADLLPDLSAFAAGIERGISELTTTS